MQYNIMHVEGTGAHRNGVGLIDLELRWLVFVGVHAGREQVEE